MGAWLDPLRYAWRRGYRDIEDDSTSSIKSPSIEDVMEDCLHSPEMTPVEIVVHTPADDTRQTTQKPIMQQM